MADDGTPIPGQPADYFLAAGFALSCFGFRFFLSFFCELFPLPMFVLLAVRRLKRRLPRAVPPFQSAQSPATFT
jgi:hypothetical protein